MGGSFQSGGCYVVGGELVYDRENCISMVKINLWSQVGKSSFKLQNQWDGVPFGGNCKG